ncbi:MAG: hypothetical protein HZB39_06200 [Planctomycetes bacterium]|nr:hypothetical protein [Planctomycetota bacterium]
MQDITEAVSSFREAARHLWNTTFYPGADWDARDRFSLVCVALFDAVVGAPFRLGSAKRPEMCEPDPAPMQAIQVIPGSKSGVPIMINRSTPRCGYWDDPVDRVCPSEVRLEFVNFFDFGELGRRDFRYVEVFICDFPSQPHLVGRRALMAFEHVSFRSVDVVSA